MKNYRPKKKLTLIACFLAMAVATPQISLLAQEDGFRPDSQSLLEEAMEARNEGDLETAIALLQELQQEHPDNQAVSNLLMNMEQELAEGVAPVADSPETPVSEEAAMEGEVETIEEIDPIAALSEEERQEQDDAIREARALISAAQGNFASGAYSDGIALLEEAEEILPVNVRTVGIIQQITETKTEATLNLAQRRLEDGDVTGARQAFRQYRQMEAKTRATERLAEDLSAELLDPENIPLESVSPEYIAERDRVREFVVQGRTQFNAGAFEDADRSFNQALSLDPDNAQALYFKQRISVLQERRKQVAREATRAEMLKAVAEKWRLPTVFMEIDDPVDVEEDEDPLQIKLDNIQIPVANFGGFPLSRVIETLSDVSAEWDNTGISPRGVNFVLIDPDNTNPEVNISLRNMSLGRILDFIVEQVNFEYEFDEDVIVIRPSREERIGLITDFFSISQNAVFRMTGGSGAATAAPAARDPFAPAPETTADDGEGESAEIRRFLQRAGVDFDGVSGSNLVFGDGRLIVTQTRRNLDRIRTILAQFTEVPPMVEIEARFLEVQEGALEELGVEWNFENRQRRRTVSGEDVSKYRARTINRNLAETQRGLPDDPVAQISTPSFEIDPVTGAIVAVGSDSLDFPVLPPAVPSAIDLAADTANFATILGRWGEYHVDATIRALSRRSGSDLLSAPKVTVMSSQTANILVAQEFRYPQSYGDPTVDSASGDGSSGVTIAPGTPLDFTMRPVGVELEVTPTVDEDEYHINMTLFPRVTEFEGFIEWGGPFVAIEGGTTAVVPSGFYQPIFNTREVRTEVTVWDGATVVLGGLTREETRTVHDKVPVLGDIPLLGRLFRSEGEAYEKRNLLIFVTANIITPGGSPANQQLRNVRQGSAFQDHYYMTPGGAARRIQEADD